MLDERMWAVESQQIADAAVYDVEVRPALARMEASGGPIESIQLSEAYLKAGGTISEARLVQAGFRLGAVLKELVKK